VRSRSSRYDAVLPGVLSLRLGVGCDLERAALALVRSEEETASMVFVAQFLRGSSNTYRTRLEFLEGGEDADGGGSRVLDLTDIGRASARILERCDAETGWGR
jgi:hypothetical protein